MTVVLNVVRTDNTFTLVPKTLTLPEHWVGRCIHCNTRLYVASDGATKATLEHIQPLCGMGEATDPRNLALACSSCNNEKGIRHDKHVGKGGRADEVIASLRLRRQERWRDGGVDWPPTG